MNGNEPNLGEMRARFWRRIQLKIGLVPRLIKFILDFATPEPEKREEDMTFQDFLNVEDPELEYVSAGDFATPEPEKREEDMTFQDFLNVEDPELEYVSAGDFATPEPEEPDDDGAFEGSESYPEPEGGLEDSEADDTIYDAEILFDNFKGELKLKNSTTKKHKYRIRDSNGKVHLIKKAK
uniref:(northern house mosquito) hypothetical protein n=1 Tax=Culex pipiens TaxID=7175 RepID=A0A8D8P2J0_CULPI